MRKPCAGAFQTVVRSRDRYGESPDPAPLARGRERLANGAGQGRTMV